MNQRSRGDHVTHRPRGLLADLSVPVAAIGNIARDWISRNWYFTDEEHERIFLCKDQGEVCVTLITTNLKSPKGLAVDPLAG